MAEALLDHADRRAILCVDERSYARVEMTYLRKAMNEGFSWGRYDIFRIFDKNEFGLGVAVRER
jgi:hypothetical protein